MPASPLSRVVLPLSIGGATPFPMSSNHPTPLNHAFREAVSYDPAKQVRVKCTFCGCWATRGEDCKQCKRPTKAVIKRRNNNVRVVVREVFDNDAAAQRAKTEREQKHTAARGTPSRSSYGAQMRSEVVARQRKLGLFGPSKNSRSPSPSSGGKRNEIPPLAAADDAFPERPSVVTIANDNEEPTVSAANPSASTTVHSAQDSASFVGAAPFTAAAAPCRVACGQCGCWAMSTVACALCLYIN